MEIPKAGSDSSVDAQTQQRILDLLDGNLSTIKDAIRAASQKGIHTVVVRDVVGHEIMGRLFAGGGQRLLRTVARDWAKTRISENVHVRCSDEGVYLNWTDPISDVLGD
jgi:hypothetical protein